MMMVCLGNICRSPLAHGILEAKIQELGWDWTVESSGTSGWHEGEKPDQRSIEVARQNGIDISRQRSQKFLPQDFETYDLIIAMDASNYNGLHQLSRNESEATKLHMLMNFAFPGENKQVPDPYYEGGFQTVFDMIEMAVDGLIQKYK